MFSYASLEDNEIEQQSITTDTSIDTDSGNTRCDASILRSSLVAGQYYSEFEFFSSDSNLSAVSDGQIFTN